MSGAWDVQPFQGPFFGAVRFLLDPILIQSYLGTGGIRIKPTGSDENRLSAGSVANPGVEGYITGLAGPSPHRLEAQDIALSRR